MAQLSTRDGKCMSPAPASVHSLDSYSSSICHLGWARGLRGFAREENKQNPCHYGACSLLDVAGEAREPGINAELQQRPLPPLQRRVVVLVGQREEGWAELSRRRAGGEHPRLGVPHVQRP